MKKVKSDDDKSSPDNLSEECIKLNNRSYKLLSSIISALDNKVRFSIISILSNIEHMNNKLKQESLYSREINSLLSEYYDINISIQMLGQHLKQLEKAGWIESIMVKKEVPNKVGLRTVKAYKIRNDVVKDLFLDINYFTNELLSLFDAHEIHLKNRKENHCTLTLVNGKSKYTSITIGKNEKLIIGKTADNFKEKPEYKYLILDKEYNIPSIAESAIKIYYENDNWCIKDESNKINCYIGEKPILPGKTQLLRDKSFLRLSREIKAAVFYCTF